MRRHGLGFEEGRDLVEHRSIAALADVAGENVRQPEVRIARLGPLAKASAAAGRPMPPLEHVAFAELLARVQHDLRPGQPRFEERQRQHILQLVAVARRAAELVRPNAAKQPRRVKLVGKPGVDQPVEVRPIRADFDLAQPLGPRGARRCKFILCAGDTDARRGDERLGPARRLAEGDRNLCFASGRQDDLTAERRHAPSVIARGAVADASLDHRGGQNIASRSTEESPADGLGRRPLEGRRGKGEAAHEIIVRVLKQKYRTNRLVEDLVDTRDGTVVERHLEEWRDTQAFRFRAAIAKRQKTHVPGIVRRHKDDIFRFEIAAPHREGRDPRLIDRVVRGAIVLKRGEARRFRFAVVEVPQVHDLSGLHGGHAVKAKGGEAVLASVAEG